jgi:pSer/pThr/pTyr-binding forkhead associated (FHA) protein
MPRVTISVPGVIPQPYRFSAERQKIRLGRAIDNDIVIECPSISQHHAEIDRTPSGYVLRDLGSTNGLKLNDSRVTRVDLAETGRIRLGDVQLNFELTAEESAAIDAETPRLPKLPSIPEDESVMSGADDPDEAQEPARKKRRRPAPTHTETVKTNPTALVGLAAIALVALFVGANLRHYQLRGETLVEKIFAPSAKPVSEASKDPAPVAPPAEPTPE